MPTISTAPVVVALEDGHRQHLAVVVHDDGLAAEVADGQSGGRGSVASSTVTSADGATSSTPVRATQEKCWPPTPRATSSRAGPRDAEPSRWARSSPAPGRGDRHPPPRQDQGADRHAAWAASATATCPGASRSTGSR